MKNIFKLIGVAALVVVIGFSMTACAPRGDPESDFQFRLNPGDGGNSVIITGHVGTRQGVNIPSRIQGMPVVAIDGGAFRERNINRVTIPNTVRVIGGRAFMGNHLVSVTIPNSVTTIGNEAFYRNHLVSVAIPNSVTTIGNGAFYRNQLTSVTIPDGVTIDMRAFQNNQITSVTIGANVSLAITSGGHGWDSNSIGHGFEQFYGARGHQAGIFTRPNAQSRDWARQMSNERDRRLVLPTGYAWVVSDETGGERAGLIFNANGTAQSIRYSGGMWSDTWSGTWSTRGNNILYTGGEVGASYTVTRTILTIGDIMVLTRTAVRIP